MHYAIAGRDFHELIKGHILWKVSHDTWSMHVPSMNMLIHVSYRRIPDYFVITKQAMIGSKEGLGNFMCKDGRSVTIQNMNGFRYLQLDYYSWNSISGVVSSLNKYLNEVVK